MERKKTYKVACSESEKKDMETKVQLISKLSRVFLNERFCTDWLLQVYSQYNSSSRLSELTQTGFVYTSHFLNWFAGSFEDIYHPEIIHVSEPTGRLVVCLYVLFPAGQFFCGAGMYINIARTNKKYSRIHF